jgi:hypothetical protein
LEELVVRLFKHLVFMHKVRSPDGLKSARAFDLGRGYPSTKEVALLQRKIFDDLKGKVIVKL